MRTEHFEAATLHLADRLTLIDGIQADALISDPPYGMSLGKLSGTSRKVGNTTPRDESWYEMKGDNGPFDPSPFIRFPKIILWGSNHYSTRLPSSRKWLVWDKREGGTPDDQADCELAWTNLEGPARLIPHRWRGFVRRGEEKLKRVQHPTQKPIAVMRWCIEQCKLAPGSVICDPFMGSGTTGIAALRAGHRFIGIEIDPRHFDTACRRVEAASRAPELGIVTA